MRRCLLLNMHVIKIFCSVLYLGLYLQLWHAQITIMTPNCHMVKKYHKACACLNPPIKLIYKVFQLHELSSPCVLSSVQMFFFFFNSSLFVRRDAMMWCSLGNRHTDFVKLYTVCIRHELTVLLRWGTYIPGVLYCTRSYWRPSTCTRTIFTSRAGQSGGLK